MLKGDKYYGKIKMGGTIKKKKKNNDGGSSSVQFEIQ